MRIAVIGAGRRHNGIGAYIARFLAAAGARVGAVLAQDAAAAQQDAAGLREFGIRAEAYADFDLLIARHRPEAVVIASPAATHADYLATALTAGIHVLCEKPFIWDDGCDCQRAAGLLEDARAQQLVVAMNSQWPFALPAYDALCGLPPVAQIESFQIQLAPLAAGRQMIPDSMPHALSLLYSVLGPGRLERLALTPGVDRLRVSFDYVTAVSRCRTTAELVREITQPRTFAFGFNGRLARRMIDMSTYRIAFTWDDRRLAVEDPLQLSVQDFMHACRHALPPRIGCAHIVDTMRMLQQVYAAWPKEQENGSGKTYQQGT